MKKFAKKALSTALALVMCAGMVSPAFAAMAFDKNAHVDDSGYLKGYTDPDETESSSPKYDYYLEDDVELDKTLKIKEGVEASFDLKGHTLGNNKGTAVDVSGELTVSDTTGNGKISGTNYGVKVETTGTLTQEGGEIHGTNWGVAAFGNGDVNLDSGSITGTNGVYVQQGNFIMTDGKIDTASTNGGAVSSQNGFTMKGGNINGFVNVQNGDFSMSDGTIIGTTGHEAVKVNNGNFSMTGGEITGAGTHGVYIANGNAQMSGTSKITQNGDAGLYVNKGNFTMTGGEISGNQHEGVKLQNGTFIMSGNSKITGSKDRAGAYVANGSFNMSGGEISGNAKGGVHVQNGDKKTSFMTGGKVSGNTGFGVYVNGGDFTMDGKDTEISGNESIENAGGVYVHNGIFTMKNGKILKNTATQYGGGVVVSGGGRFVMQGGRIAENEVKKYMGGGVYVSEATFEMSGGEITDNKASSPTLWTPGESAPFGGGVALNKASFKMTGGKITKNSATQMGGGIYAWQNSKIELSGDAEIADNTVSAEGKGASIALNLNSSASILQDSSDGTEVDFGLIEKYDDHSSSITTTNFIVSIDKDGNVSITNAAGDAVAAIVDANGTRVDSGSVVDSTLTLTLPLALYVAPAVTPGTGDGTTIDDAAEDPDETEIADPAVPLASGPVTRAEFIDYLWRHEGEPASDGVCTFTDVPEDHEYVLALAWAEQNKVAFAYDDGTFEPDELVTVAAVREFLGNFETVFGRQPVAASALTTLTGADDEAVLNCDEVLAEFFGA